MQATRTSPSVGASNASVAGGAGNDTFVVTASNLQTASTLVGGAGNDSVSFGGDLSGGYVFGGSGNDTLNFTAGNNNNANVSGDAGSDLLLFTSTLSSWDLWRFWC